VSFKAVLNLRSWLTGVQRLLAILLVSWIAFGAPVTCATQSYLLHQATLDATHHSDRSYPNAQDSACAQLTSAASAPHFQATVDHAFLVDMPMIAWPRLPLSSQRYNSPLVESQFLAAPPEQPPQYA